MIFKYAFHFALAFMALILVSCDSGGGVRSKEERERDPNVLEEYVKVPIDKAKDLREAEDERSEDYDRELDEASKEE